MAHELPAFIRWPPLHIPAADVKSLTGGRWMNMVRKIRRGPSPRTTPPKIIISLFDPRLRFDLACRSALHLVPPLEGRMPEVCEGPGKGMGHLPDWSV